MEAETEPHNVQALFIEQLRTIMPSTVSLADELAETLNISRDSAYRRIRGETPLSLDEVNRIFKHYPISIDSIISPKSNSVLIHHQAVDFNHSLKEWLSSLIQKLVLVKSSTNPELIFSAKDIPVFHYFRSPLLTAFKFFVWLKSVIRDPQYENMLFDADAIHKEILYGSQKAWQLYASIPTTEIWSDEIIIGTLKQIQFYYQCAYFNDNTIVKEILDALLGVIQEVRQDASIGEKSAGGGFELYCNEILIPDNTIFGKMNNQSRVYINYNTMDLLSSQQESFCERTEAYMKNLINSSSRISTTAEKERNRFFSKIESKIEACKLSIV
ncbi:MAG: hypothetical protein KF687_03540 [Cyclobacteriaceae bacterium]|nr:hypothetical protein [Cyclobacteriaceae bacterium]